MYECDFERALQTSGNQRVAVNGWHSVVASGYYYECVNGCERQPAISHHRMKKEKGVYGECWKHLFGLLNFNKIVTRNESWSAAMAATLSAINWPNKCHFIAVPRANNKNINKRNMFSFRNALAVAKSLVATMLFAVAVFSFGRSICLLTQNEAKNS